MTEDEHKQLWCPHVRAIASVLGSGDGSTFNRILTDQNIFDAPTGALCIGSACAMWRWHKPGLVFRDRVNEETGELEGEAVREAALSDDGQPTGYCGLAGKP